MESLKDKAHRECEKTPVPSVSISSANDMSVPAANSMNAVKHTDEYGEEFWFTGQLFEEMWTPRETPEHSPLRSLDSDKAPEMHQ